MRIYFVDVNINNGEHEKPAVVLVEAETKDLAIDYAIYTQSQVPASLEWSEEGACDAGAQYEYLYTATAQLVEEAHEVVLKQYLRVETGSLDDLVQSGDYKAVRLG